MRVPTFSAWKKSSIRQRSSYQRSTVRAVSRPASPSVASSIQCSGSLFFPVAGRRGGSSSRAETAVMRTGASPARSFGGSRSTGVQRSVSFAVRPFLRFGPPLAGTSIFRAPTGSVPRTCSQRPASSPEASATRRFDPRLARTSSAALVSSAREISSQKSPSCSTGSGSAGTRSHARSPPRSPRNRPLRIRTTEPAWQRQAGRSACSQSRTWRGKRAQSHGIAVETAESGAG